MNRLPAVLFLTLILNLAICPTQGRGGDITIRKGSRVSFDYTLTVDGEVVDSSLGRQPLEYTHGAGGIIPGLSRRLEGLRVGDERTVKVAPEEAYGLVDPEAFQEVKKTQLPSGLEPQVGMLLQVSSSEGNAMLARIAEIKRNSVILDFNHPLAGKTLIFWVKIISIK